MYVAVHTRKNCCHYTRSEYRASSTWATKLKSYEAGTQATLGRNASKNCFNDVWLPRLEKTIFVLSLAPVQSKIGVWDGVGVNAGVLELAGVARAISAFLESADLSPLGEVHWKSWLWFAVRKGASEKLSGLLLGSRYPIIKLPPKIGSWIVPEALTRHVLRGSNAGR